MNNVSLAGNVASDITARRVGHEDRLVVNFRLAVHRPFTKDKTDFFDITAWQKQAEIVDRYVKKGHKVGIVATAQTEEWEKDGQKRSKVVFVASQVILMTTKKEAEALSGDDIPYVPTAARVNVEDAPF